MPPSRIVVRGGGEMGSGTAWRLRRCGYDVIIAETDSPTAIRRWVCFSEAVYDAEKTVESVRGVRCGNWQEVERALARRLIAVVVCPSAQELAAAHPEAVVDAILAKAAGTTSRGLAQRVIGLGPGFVVGDEVDCVIETNRGPNLGRCIWQGSAEPNTGVPGPLGGETAKRVLRAPSDGTLEPIREIGDQVRAGDLVATVGELEVFSELTGIVRGMMRPGITVRTGTKIGDIDPRGDSSICRRISDKALAIAGGVLESLLSDPSARL